MWNTKHLIIAIIFAVCTIVCAVAWLFFDGGNLQAGFTPSERNSSFAPMGTAIFAFFSIVFFRNSRR